MESSKQTRGNWEKGLNEVFDKDDPEAEYIFNRLGSSEEHLDILQTSVVDGIDASTLNLRKLKYGPNTLSLWLTIKPLFFLIVSNPVLYFSLLIFVFKQSINYFLDALVDLSNFVTIIVPVLLISSINIIIDLYVTLKQTQLISESKYKVIRNSKKCKILCNDIVVGDIIHLKSGEIAPSDIIIISSSNLYINDSFYTGKLRNTVFGGLALRSNSEIINGKMIGVAVAVGKNRASYRNFGSNIFLETGTEFQQWIINKYKKPLKVFFILIIFMKFFNYFITNKGFSTEKLSLSLFLPTLLNLLLLINLYLLISSNDLGLKIPFLVYSKAYPHFKPISLQLSLQKFTSLSQLSSICIDLCTITQASPKVLSLSIGNNLSTSLSDLYQVSNNSLEILLAALSTILQIQHSNTKTSDQTLSALNDLFSKFDSKKNRVFFTIKQIFFFEQKNLFIFVVESNKIISFYAYGPSKYLIQICKFFISSEGKKTDFYESQKFGLMDEYVNAKEGWGRKVISIAYKQINLQEWMRDAGESGEFSLNQSLESLVLIGSVEISYPVDLQILRELKKSHESGVDIKIMTEDSVKSAVSLGKSCGILPNQYKFTLEDSLVISGDDLMINNNLLMNSPNGNRIEHSINKRMAGIKVLAEANAEQKSVFLKKIKELNGKVARIQQKGRENEFSFGIKKFEFVAQAILWSKFEVFVAKWYLDMYIEVMGTWFFIGLWAILSGTEIGIEILYFFIDFLTFLGLFTLILLRIKPDVEGIAKRGVAKWEFSYSIVFFRVIFNLFSTLVIIFQENIAFWTQYSELAGFDKFGETGIANNFKVSCALKYLMYLNLFSLLTKSELWKNNQLLRGIIAILIVFFCEKVQFLVDHRGRLVGFNEYILVLCISSMLIREFIESLLSCARS